MSSVQEKPLTKTEKAAVMMLCMDEKTTSDLFNHLNDEEIRKMGGALLRLNQIPNTQIQEVVEEFNKQFIKSSGSSDTAAPGSNDISIDGKHVLEKLLSKTLPKNRGQTILSTIRNLGAPSKADLKDFGKLVNQYSADLLYNLLKEEHPQLIAIMLSYAKRTVAKEVLEKFPEDRQTDLLSRMAKLNKISGQVIQELGTFVASQAQEKSVAVDDKKEDEEGGEQVLEGIEHALKLLKSIPRSKANKIIAEIEKTDKELADLLAKKLFTIEDLERADDPGIRELLRNIKTEDMKASLKNAADGLKNKFFKNMSERAASILREDMEVMPPVKVEEIETAQNNILAAAKKLLEEEKLKLAEIVDDEDR